MVLIRLDFMDHGGGVMKKFKLFSRYAVLCFFLFVVNVSISLAPVESLNAQSLILENDHLRVELSEIVPAVNRYVLKSNDQVIYGLDEFPYAYVYSENYENGFSDIEEWSVENITQGDDRILYHMIGLINSKPVVTFDLCYILSGNSMKLTFGNVQETPGYKLIVVRTPFLLTVRPDQGQVGAKMIFPYSEGRLIDVATTTSGNFEDYNTGGMAHAMLMGMLYHQGALAICSYDHLDMNMGEWVIDHPNIGRLGAIDIYFNYRHPPTNFGSASFVDVFDEQTTSLSAKLTILADYDQDGDIDWIDGAKFLRNQVKAVPDPRYVSSWITKVVRYESDKNIFDQLNTIEKLYHLTDHNKIYGYLVGYNPKIFSIFGTEGDLDPQWASLDDLKQVFETAQKSYNTFLSFNDVYLDYYPGTPRYDPDLRVVNPDGEFVGGWPLPDYSAAYKADPYEYALQVGLQRVGDTMSLYPIKESHHIDAFHFRPDKDHSLASPSSHEKNRRGIKLIIDEFNKYGVDITAEGLTGFFVGPGTGWFLDTPRILEDDNLPWSGAEPIPLIEFIYHGKTLYGLYEDIYYDDGLSPEQLYIYTFLEPLLLGASSASHITFTEPDDLELDKFYLIDLPWMALNRRFMQDYVANGSYRKITYDNNTFVEINYDSNTYTVKVDGKIIGQNYTTFFPKNRNTYLIFSRFAKRLNYPLPHRWTADKTRLMRLNESGNDQNVAFNIVNNNIIFDAEANTPYKLIREVDKVIFSPIFDLLLLTDD